VTRRAGRSLTLAVLVAIAVSGCGGGAAPSGSGPSQLPSASVPALTEADLAVCDGTVRMGEGVARLDGLRVRRQSINSIGGALDLVLEGQRLVLDYAPGRMRTRVRTLGFSVTNLVIAIEGLETADRVEAAVATIRRRTTALGRALDNFRTWVGCPSPTDRPPASTPPG
jgi:hypothetical protein